MVNSCVSSTKTHNSNEYGLQHGEWIRAMKNFKGVKKERTSDEQMVIYCVFWNWMHTIFIKKKMCTKHVFTMAERAATECSREANKKKAITPILQIQTDRWFHMWVHHITCMYLIFKYDVKIMHYCICLYIVYHRFSLSLSPCVCLPLSSLLLFSRLFRSSLMWLLAIFSDSLLHLVNGLLFLHFTINRTNVRKIWVDRSGKKTKDKKKLKK